jgi:hypothetical protein
VSVKIAIKKQAFKYNYSLLHFVESEHYDLIEEIGYAIVSSDSFEFTQFVFLSELDIPFFYDMPYEDVKRWFLDNEADIAVDLMCHGYDVAVIPIEYDIIFKSTRIYQIKINNTKPFSPFKYRKRNNKL